jgi:hypothetical protein
MRTLFSKQLIDQIAFVISTVNDDDDDDDILRRYLIEFRPIIDQSSNTIHNDGHRFLAELDIIFAGVLKELIRQQATRPTTSFIDNEQLRWKLQIRLCHHGNSKLDLNDTFIEQFKLAHHAAMSIRQVKSLHAQRLDLQLIYQDKNND